MVKIIFCDAPLTMILLPHLFRVFSIARNLNGLFTNRKGKKMKTYQNIVVALGVLFGSAGVSFGAQSYPLTCRGGAGTLGYSSTDAAAMMYFTKTSGPAGAGLGPGQCSWADRAVGQAEPTCLRQTGVHTNAWIFPGAQRAQSYFAPSASAPWLRSLLDATKFQTFQVYNPGTGGCFVVTRLGA